MEYLNSVFTEQQIYDWELVLDEWFFIIAMGILFIELLRLVIYQKITWNIIWDTIANFITLFAFIVITVALTAVYLAVYYFFYEYLSITQLPINGWTIIICILLADFVYYWEHRMMHVWGFGWATHTVHHSSPHFNISVAYRFGPLDSVIPVFFHIPLAIIGFNPILIFFSEMVVQLYQTALHTELINKLPKPIEAIMNTPSHHRVHHGSNKQYLDKNYSGIFIIWDKLFGTFESEKEKVSYGILPPLNSVNPIRVFFHGITGLCSKMYNEPNWKNKLAYLFKPPSWSPEQD